VRWMPYFVQWACLGGRSIRGISLVSDFMPPGGEPDTGAERPTQSEEFLDSHGGDPFDPAAEPTPPKARRTGLIVGGALAAVGVVGAAAWGASWLLNDGPDAAEALPAGTLGYVSINFDPSGEQKLEALQTLKKFPGLKDKLDFDTADDVRKHIFEEIQNSGDCKDVDYGKDIEPWLGNGMAVAAVDAGEDHPSPVGVIEVTDEGKAWAGFDKLAACDEPADEVGIAFNGDWAIVAETQEIADRVVADAEAGTLADDETYQSWLDEAGDSGIMTLYAAPEAGPTLLDVMESEMAGPGFAGAELPQVTRDQFEDFKGMVGVVRFHDGALELEFAGDFNPKASGIDFSTTGGDDVVATLPADTAFAYGLSLPDGFFDYMFDAMAPSLAPGESPDQLIAEMEQETGLELPEDFESLVGESIAIAVSSHLDIDQVSSSGDASGLEVGFKVKGDADKANAVLDKIRPQLGSEAYILGSKDADGFFVVGPNSAYLDALLASGNLGDDATYQEVIAHSEDASGVMYLNFDAGDNWLVNLLKDSGAPAEVTDNVEPLSAFGVSAWMEGDVSHGIVKLTTD